MKPPAFGFAKRLDDVFVGVQSKSSSRSRRFYTAGLLVLTISARALAAAPAVDLRDSLRPTPVRDAAAGMVKISGRAEVADGAAIRVRVMTSLGQSFATQTAARDKQFACRFPQDFPGAPRLAPMLLYVDATDTQFGGADILAHQAEVLIVVTGREIPDLPLAFCDDFIDAQGRKDAACAQWPRQRALVNSFMRSRAARLMGIGRADFDLAVPADFEWFKNRAALYDFDHRDRDWTQPLGNRVARGFWQAVWNSWFNASNDHPWDGNPANRAPGNFRPYTFANDPADILVLYQMLRRARPVAADNRIALADEVLQNLLALQHRRAENFALKEDDGRQEVYTAGAFRYGMFETGEWLTEGKGWFANPKFRDFQDGGVFNGRCVWALGESLKASPRGPQAARLREAIALALTFCLGEGKYTLRTKSGLPVWNRTAGEHGYLLLGMLAACEVEPELPVQLGEKNRPLREVTADALDAMAEIARPDGTWSDYANADANNIAALAGGARVLAKHQGAPRWKSAAMRAADVWLSLKPLPAENTAPTPLFGHRKEGGTTFYLGSEARPHRSLYTQGLWLQALAVLHAVSQEPRYSQRAHAILAYFCGDNPLQVRLLSEIGSINNRITDTDKDGSEDVLHWNAYPESTAFVQIGLLELVGR